MLERLRQMLGGSTETREIDLEDVMEAFMERHGDEIDSLTDTGEQKRQAVHDAITELEDSLGILASYDGENARVEDVTSNVASRRERAIERFEPPEDLQDFTEVARDLADDISHVREKEKMVLDQVGEAADTVFSKVRMVEDAVQDLERFLQERFDPVRRYAELEDLFDQLHSLETEKDEISDSIASIDLQDTSEQLQDVEDRLEALEDDPEQEEKERFRSERDELRSNLTETRHEIEEAISEMERGLRKLLYDIESGEIEIDRDHVDVLREIESGEILDGDRPAGAIEDAVRAANEHIEEVDVGERQLERFRDAASNLEEIQSVREKTTDLEEQIEAIEHEIAGLTIDERRNEIEEERSQILEDLGAMEREEEQLEQRLAIKRQAIEETKDEIEALLDEALREDVVLMDGD